MLLQGAVVRILKKYFVLFSRKLNPGQIKVQKENKQENFVSEIKTFEEWFVKMTRNLEWIRNRVKKTFSHSNLQPDYPKIFTFHTYGLKCSLHPCITFKAVPDYISKKSVPI